MSDEKHTSLASRIVDFLDITPTKPLYRSKRVSLFLFIAGSILLAFYISDVLFRSWSSQTIALIVLWSAMVLVTLADLLLERVGTRVILVLRIVGFFGVLTAMAVTIYNFITGS